MLLPIIRISSNFDRSSEFQFSPLNEAARRSDRCSKNAELGVKSPATTLLPGGETISDVQRRGLKVINEGAQKIPGGRFLFVPQGDVMRAILCHYMKLPLNEYRRLRVDNGSLSALQTDRRWVEIKYVNYRHEIILASKEPYMAAKAAALRR